MKRGQRSLADMWSSKKKANDSIDSEEEHEVIAEGKEQDQQEEMNFSSEENGSLTISVICSESRLRTEQEELLPTSEDQSVSETSRMTADTDGRFCTGVCCNDK